MRQIEALFVVVLVACGGEERSTSSTSASVANASSTAASTGEGGASVGSTTGSGASGGAGGSTVASLDAMLMKLRMDRDGTLLAESSADGWPVLTDQGFLFVSADGALTELAGDHDQWMPEAMKQDQGFSWIVEKSLPNDEHYKFTDSMSYAADPWSRGYAYDQYGEISLALATATHLERWFSIGDAKMLPRTVRVLVPASAPTRVLYVHDGQNLFDPSAPWGGWHLQDMVPAGMMLVGIDNTPARMDEYTHVPDVISGQMVGGKGDDYADFLKATVRPLIASRYGEPAKIGVMGSSLGGLISLHAADHDPGDYAFAASLSGTLGWGSIGAGVHNPTIIERYQAHGHGSAAIYIDSGGSGNCVDSDNDGIEDDDPTAGDNYCENLQMKGVLSSVGYVTGTDLFYTYTPGAQHNEMEWAARVPGVLQIFAGL